MLYLTMRLCGRQVCGRSKLHGRHRLSMLNRVGGGSGLHVLEEEAAEQRSCWPDGRNYPGGVDWAGQIGDLDSLREAHDDCGGFPPRTGGKILLNLSNEYVRYGVFLGNCVDLARSHLHHLAQGLGIARKI